MSKRTEYPMRHHYFRRLAPLVQKFAIPVLQDSTEYSDITSDLERILLLGDRLLVASKEGTASSGVFNIAACIEALDIALDSGKDGASEACSLVNELEKWMKFIYSIVDPVGYNLEKGNHRFTLAPVIEKLNLLTSSENSVAIANLNTIADPVRQRIRLIRTDRNDATHTIEGLWEESRTRFISALLVALIAPIHKHYEKLRNELLGLIVEPIEAHRCDTLLAMVSSERGNHLDFFAGREDWTVRLTNLLRGDERQEGRYILLYGEEGSGKSALCAHLSSALVPKGRLFGGALNSVQKHADWLPGSIIHFGKQSNHISEIVESLTIQINTMLLMPIHAPFLRASETSYNSDIYSAKYQVDSPWLKRHFDKKNDGETDELASLRNEDEDAVNVDIRQVPYVEMLRRHLYEALQRLVIERGHATVILDALDEMSVNAEDLDFLPHPLPRGATVLLTVRSGLGIDTWLENNRQVEKLELARLSRAEIPLLTEVEDDPDSPGHLFNDKVWEASRGWPFMVAATSRTVREKGSFIGVEVQSSIQHVLDRQAKEWEGKVLSKLLPLLATFEPVEPLDVTLVQGFLARNGIVLRRPELMETLKQVGAQLAGIDAGHVKLGIKAFGEHVRSKHFSIKDLRQDLSEIVLWLSEEEDVDARTLALFLKFWTNTELVPNKDRQCTEISSKLIDLLSENGKFSLLFQMANAAITSVKVKKQGTSESTLAIFERCLRLPADSGLIEAQSRLGSELVTGRILPQDLSEGESWLERAASSGNVDAMLALGARLLFGFDLKKDVIAGEQWLERAAKLELSHAKLLLSLHYLRYGMSIQDREKGEHLLRAAAKDSPSAMAILGERLIHGDVINKDVTEGIKLLRIAAEKGDTQAARKLGLTLLWNEEITNNSEDGEKYLRQAADSGVEQAIFDLGMSIVLGKISPQDVGEGERLITQAAEKNTFSKGNVGRLLLLYENVPEELRELGTKYIEEAAEQQVEFKRTLAGWRIDGNHVTKDIEAGHRSLLDLAVDGDSRAQHNLGLRLLFGYGLSQDIQNAFVWLKRASENGEADATYWIGKELIEGGRIEIDVPEGVRLVEDSANRGITDAMNKLGAMYQAGQHVEKDLSAAERWYREGAENDDPISMRRLACLLLDTLDRKDEGIHWLKAACDAGDAGALASYGARLLSGSGVESDEQTGEALLQRAVEIEVEELVGVAFEYYEMGNFKIAGKLFQIANNGGARDAANNLAYMIRRGEYSPKPQVSVVELLKDELTKGHTFAVVNMSLCLASGNDCGKDWAEATRLIETLKNKENLLDLRAWWQTLAVNKDGEGHLVLGMLSRADVIADPEGLTYVERFQLANERGWQVPDWLFAH